MIFNKKKQIPAENALDSILNALDTAVVVVRGKDCEVLYINKTAEQYLPSKAYTSQSCKTGLCDAFPDFCDFCSHQSDYGDPSGSESFETINAQGETFSCFLKKVEWLDKRSATLLCMRNISPEMDAQKSLYNLAYLDHLTGVPNRQKLKEVFDAISKDIESGAKSGIIAMFDLDNFKAINDTYGHNTGDVMLRRLTEHFEGDPAFAGHLYRLGGDEFVLLFVDTPGQFASETEQMLYYDKLLDKCLLSYSMPNIELACTLSMGIASFPQYGHNYSELLRKADIALYKAKTAGRNQKIFFQDRYDTAKKFKDLFINIKPILTDQGNTFGYEMTDRGNSQEQSENSMVLVDFDQTIDALGINDIDSSSRYFLSFTRQLLNPAVLKNLPRDKFIIQVPATPTVSSQQLDKYTQLKMHGFSLSLTGVQGESSTPADLLALADYVKFDDKALTNPVQVAFMQKHPGKKYIASHVNTEDDFLKTRRQGFALFQGFFFNTPTKVHKTKAIDPLKVNYLRLLKLTSTENYVDFKEISSIISSDVALSYKLLRLLNSAAVGLRNPVSSIEMAVAYLGEEHLKKWIALLALRGIASDKPLELVRMSLIRAQFAELLCPHLIPPGNAKHAFLVGMFSLLHIALEKSKEELFDEIPVAAEIRLSLTTSTGPFSDMVAFFENYEYANWDDVARYAEKYRLRDSTINEAYISAVKWYNELIEQ